MQRWTGTSKRCIDARVLKAGPKEVSLLSDKNIARRRRADAALYWASASANKEAVCKLTVALASDES
jgi:hypothetical protein